MLQGTAGVDTITGSNQNDSITGFDGGDTLNGGDGDDRFNHVSASHVTSSEVVNGGGGNADTIALNGSMDISLSAATISGVEVLDFDTGTATARLANNQIGAGAIATVDGSVQVDTLVVSGQSVNLLNVTFTNWTSGSDLIQINGNSAATNALIGSTRGDIITGGNLDDIITGHVGADTLIGGDGNDRFEYSASNHIEAGESIDGGAGTGDQISITNGAVLDFSNGVTITGVEDLVFGFAQNGTVTLAASQISGSGIREVIGSSGVNSLTVTGLGAGFLGVTFTSWTDGVDQIVINGATNQEQTLRGSQFRDTINGGNLDDDILSNGGADVLNGNGGNDRFSLSESAMIASGGTIDGGAGTGDLIFLSGSEFDIDLTGITISNVEIVELTTPFFGLDQTVRLRGDQVGAGRINTFVADSGNNGIVIVTGASIDLSTATFTNFGADSATILNGTGGSDSIVGSSRADRISGGGGNDTMAGGGGDDTYFVEEAGDVVSESSGQGFDIVDAFVNYTLQANVEMLIVLGAATAGTGNSGDNVLQGSFSGNGLTLDGAEGNDTLYGSMQGDTLIGGDGNDTLLGNANFSLAEVAGNSMIGGAGDDAYYSFSVGDTITENLNGGTDVLVAYNSTTLSANVEQLILLGLATSGTGNELDNLISGFVSTNALMLDGAGGNDVIYGSAQSDTLIGGTDNDLFVGLGGTNTLVGGSGDDVYYVESATDFITENANEGFDTVVANQSIVLSSNIEQVIVQGVATSVTGTSGSEIIYGLNSTLGLSIDGSGGSDTIYGSNQSDSFTGGLGNDVMLGFGGTNTFTGGGGDDQYYTSSASDVLTESLNDGYDIVVASYNTTLGANFEELILLSGATTGTGNNDANVLNGAIAGAGVTLSGLGGADSLVGGNLADVLNGGLGNDTHFGGGGPIGSGLMQRASAATLCRTSLRLPPMPEATI